MAAINIYVGNLSFDTGEDQLKELFESFGTGGICHHNIGQVHRSPQRIRFC